MRKHQKAERRRQHQALTHRRLGVVEQIEESGDSDGVIENLRLCKTPVSALDIIQRIKDDNFGFAVMLSGNCQVRPYLEYYDTNTGPPDNYQTTYDSKTKIVVFYSLSNAF